MNKTVINAASLHRHKPFGSMPSIQELIARVRGEKYREPILPATPVYSRSDVERAAGVLSKLLAGLDTSDNGNNSYAH